MSRYIQTGSIVPENVEKIGKFGRFFSFDCMESSEFEFGTIDKVRDFFTKNFRSYRLIEIPVSHGDQSTELYGFVQEEDISFVTLHVQNLIKNPSEEHSLKEAVHLYDNIFNIEEWKKSFHNNRPVIDFWLDIGRAYGDNMFPKFLPSSHYPYLIMKDKEMLLKVIMNIIRPCLSDIESISVYVIHKGELRLGEIISRQVNPDKSISHVVKCQKKKRLIPRHDMISEADKGLLIQMKLICN